MIPFFELKPWGVIQPFGVLMAAGVFAGSHMARLYQEKHKLDEETLRWLGIRLIIYGFIGCHLINTFFYEPHRLKEDPLLVFKVWDGISSYGGIVSALITFFVLTRRYEKMNKLKYLDMIVYGVVPGFFFGRVGCAIVHDHIGVATDFPLAVDFPPRSVHGVVIQGPHHDLGLYEVPVLLVLWGLVWIMGRSSTRKDGVMSCVVAILYAVPRFFFEYLRLEQTDPRYLGLTPAQYFSIGFVVLGVYGLFRIYGPRGALPRATIVSDPDGHSIPIPESVKKAQAKAAQKKKKKKR